MQPTHRRMKWFKKSEVLERLYLPDAVYNLSLYISCQYRATETNLVYVLNNTSYLWLVMSHDYIRKWKPYWDSYVPICYIFIFFFAIKWNQRRYYLRTEHFWRETLWFNWRMRDRIWFSKRCAISAITLKILTVLQKTRALVKIFRESFKKCHNAKTCKRRFWS